MSWAKRLFVIVGKQDGYAIFARLDRTRVDGGYALPPLTPINTVTDFLGAEALSRVGYVIENGDRVKVASSKPNASGSLLFESTVGWQSRRQRSRQQRDTATR